MFKRNQEQSQPGYMQKLNAWLDEHVFGPLSDAFEESAEARQAGATEDEEASRMFEVIDAVRREIREEMLQSYKNGKAAGNRPERRPRGSYRR
jgi:hypothetical protein